MSLAAYAIIIHKPLAGATFNCFYNSISVIQAARVPTESELAAIAMQVFWTHAVVNSVNSTFEQAEK